jgi:hypothetical protein
VSDSAISGVEVYSTRKGKCVCCRNQTQTLSSVISLSSRDANRFLGDSADEDSQLIRERVHEGASLHARTGPFRLTEHAHMLWARWIALCTAVFPANAPSSQVPQPSSAITSAAHHLRAQNVHLRDHDVAHC